MTSYIVLDNGDNIAVKDTAADLNRRWKVAKLNDYPALRATLHGGKTTYIALHRILRIEDAS